MEEANNTEIVVEPKKEKLWTKRNTCLLLSIGYANFLLGTCYSLPAPFFPKEAELKGASPTVYGLVFGVFQLVNLIMSPIWGKMMPYLVPRFVLISGMFVAGSCSVLFGCLQFSPPGNPFIILCFFVRIVESIGVTAYITTCYGMIPVIFPQHIATVLSTMETIFGFGMIAGPTVGGALYQVGGYYLPFVVMGGCLMFGSILTSMTFAGKDDPPEEKTGSMFKMVAAPSMVVDVLIFTMGSICIGFNDATLEPHLRQFSLSPAVLGSVFIIPGGIYAFVSPVYGFLMDKGVKPHYLCLFGCCLGFLTFILIGPAPFLPFKTSVPLVIVSLVLLGFGLGAQNMSAFIHGMQDIKERGFPDNVSTYALYTGVVMAFSSLGAFVGPSLGGFMLDHVGYENGTYLVFSLEGFLIVILCVYLVRDSLCKNESPTTSPEEKESSVNIQDNERSPLIRKSSVSLEDGDRSPSLRRSSVNVEDGERTPPRSTDDVKT